MTATSLAAQVAAVHLGPINASRKRAGLAPLDAATLAREFADVDRYPVRTKAVALRTTSTNQAAADSMWGGIVARLNGSLPSSREPIAARTSPPVDSRAVDWSSIASALNREAGLAMPARRAR
jgi:hypothetical protein